MAEFGASSFCRDCSTAVDSTGGSEGTVVEESGFRGGGDLSAPWLRHSGRDDSGMVATPVEMMAVGWWQWGGGHSGRDDCGVVATSVEITGLDRVQLGLKRAIFGFLGFAVTQFGCHL